MIDRYLELLSPLGVRRPPLRFGLQVPAEIDAWAAELTARPPLAGDYVVLNPGAGWDSRLWPTERYVEVARQLGQWGLGSLVTWGGKRERGWAEEIVAGAGPAAVLAPPTTLIELTAVARRARLLVASDTGPLHLAAAVGTPCVGLFGTTRREETGPLGSQHELLQSAYDSSDDRKRPGADNWAMRRIGAAMVINACRRLLDSNPVPAAAQVAASASGDLDRAA
jgi:ADP-heptose:LPS heptosyltransferase